MLSHYWAQFLMHKVGKIHNVDLENWREHADWLSHLTLS